MLLSAPGNGRRVRLGFGRHAVVAGAAVFVLAAGSVLAGCGTRLPASTFTGQAGSGGLGPGGGGGSAFVSGVSATTIKVGMIDSITSPLGAEAFSGPGYGAQAYFDALNAAGGV